MTFSLGPVSAGVAATVAAMLAILSWAAIGGTFVRPGERDDPIYLPGTILIGSAVTAAALSVFARVGQVRTGCGIVALTALVILAIRAREVLAAVRETMRPVARVLGLKWRVPFALLGAIAWVYAIAPPRDADAMRYHLAHLRQIITEGKWTSIADFHYAIPFAWTLGFLPFEQIGFPQAAQLTNLLLLVVIVASFVTIAGNDRERSWSVVLVFLFAAHPMIVRTFTSATADGYAILVLFTSGMLLLRLDRLSLSEAALLGFVAWTGAGSRYQLIVWGAIVTVLFLLRLRNSPDRGAFLGRYATGAAAALLLASPFYIVNFMSFGNPVWPFLVSRAAAAASYESAIARGYADALVSGLSPRAMIHQLVGIVRPDVAFPIAAAILAICVAGLVLRRGRTRLLSLAGLVFALAWLPSWSVLYPRLVLPLAGVALLIALELRRDESRGVPKAVLAVAIAAAIAFTSATVYAGLDHLRYAVSGDARRFHRYTWFYDLYDRVNRTTSKDARFLVIVYSGHSYYLDRPYRRADPWLSAVVDWRRVSTGAALDSVLAAGGFDWVIYQQRDWSQFVGGAGMAAAVADAIDLHYLIPDTAFRERLYTSRLGGTFDSAEVLLLRRRRQ